MNFTLFALVIAAAFFVCSLVLLNFGRHLGTRYLQRQKGAGSMAGLTTVEGAVFALIGLLLAFTISGALQRFDERRQLVIQEANAVSTAYDRLGLLEGGVSNNLQMKLKDYVRARIDLYRMPHDFSLWQQTELFSPKQQDKILDLKTKVWNATVAACPSPAFSPYAGRRCLRFPMHSKSLDCASAPAKNIHRRLSISMLFGLGLGGSLLAGFGMAAASARSWISHGGFRRHSDGGALRCY